MTESTIRALEGVLRAAQLRSDVAALDRLIDDAVVFTGPDGARASKADDLGLHASGALRFTAHETLEVFVRSVTPDVTVVALRARLAGRYLGADFAGDFHYTRVWVRRDDGWRIVVVHAAATATVGA